MALSVIVTSYNSPATLRKCLESLTGQREAEEIIIADCSDRNPEENLAAVFPAVRFLHFDQPRSVPGLRWAGYERTGGDVIAATEARCVPSPTWCAELIQAHRNAPDAPAIGGPVALVRPASALDLGLYFSEYGLFAPPTPVGEVRQISGANLSYKRRALEESRDLLEAGEWETLLHERWLRLGRKLRMCRAAVFFQNSMSGGTAARQRFHYGRRYAADRVRAGRWWRRFLYAAFTPVLPGLLVWRAARGAHRSGRLPDLTRALPWIVFFSSAWSAGEFVGYLFGRSRRTRVF